MKSKRYLIVLLLGLCSLVKAQPVIITPPVAYIEPGQSVTLTASGASFYLWSPAAGLSTTIGPVTVASPEVTTTYTCTGYGPGAESVVNGDFEQGNVGFVSSYQYNSNLWGEGTYYVGANAHDYHSGFTGLAHGGSGMFMIVNGATSPGTNVWTETISVMPNTYYAFSTWACNVSVGDPNQVALLQFSINGTQLGDIFSAPNELNTWTQFYEIWYSGASTSAIITILNQNTAGGGNDFGLDDISFCQLVYLDDEQCTVNVEAMMAVDDHQQGCYGETIVVPFLENDQILQNCNNFNCQIIQQASHGTAAYANETMTYTPNTGFSGTDQFRYRISCGSQMAEATVFVTVYPQYVRQLSVSGCESYVWHGMTFTHTTDTTVVVPGVAPNGCDSIYQLHVDIHEDEEVILPAVETCDSYTWHGTTYTQSGYYTYQTTTQWGCLRLEHLPLTIHYGDTVDYEVTACEEYVWHGQAYHQSGNYTYTTTNQYGCTRLERLSLSISDSYREVEEATECDGYYWPRSQRWYYQSAVDSIVVQGGQGQCDSTFVLDLTIHYGDTLEVYPEETVCGSYEWHGTTYTESGTYPYVTTNEYGCERLERLHLTVSHDTESEVSVTSCDAYEWFGTLYDRPGDYQHHLPNAQGCDSLITLHLEMGEIFTMEEYAESCTAVEWHGTTYTESGDYEHLVESPDGCDSLFVLHLEIGGEVTGEATAHVCEPFQWHEHYCDHSGDYQHAFATPLGCDSIVTLHVYMGETEVQTHFVESCEPYEFGGVVYDVPGEYLLWSDTVHSPHGCDSIIDNKMLRITALGHIEEQEGSYEVYVASNLIIGIYRFEVDMTDAVSPAEWAISNPEWRIVEAEGNYCRVLASTPGHVTLRATFRVAQCAEKDCVFDINAGFFAVDDRQGVEARIYPNPTRGEVSVASEGIERVRVIDMMGQTLEVREMGRKDQVTLNLGVYAPSVYLLEIETVNGIVKKRVAVCR